MSRRSYPVPPPGFPPFAAPGPAGIEEEEEVDPQAHYTCLDQVWDQYTMGNWLTRKPKPPSLQASANTRLIFKAYNRVYGDFGPSIDDHTWIDFKSQPLIDLLRSEESLKGAGALLQNQPGIDARDLFLRLPRLKELAIEPTIEDEPAPAPTSPSAEYQTPEAASASVVSLGPESATAPTIPTLGLVRSAKNDPPVPTAAPVLTAPPGPPATVGSLLSAPEQLYLLVKFIENHFKDTVEEFERVKQDGYMSFKLLWMLCVPGSVVEVEDEATGHPTGVKIGSWGYGSDGRTLTVQGLKYVWDGKVYKQAQIPVGVLQFKGLMKLGQVPIKALSDQVHQQLIERGKLYEKFAGVQHLRYDSFVIVKTACGYVKRPSKGRVMVDSAGFYRFNLNAPGGPRDMGYHQAHPSRKAPPAKTIAEEYQPSEPLPDEVLCLTPPAHLGWSFRAKLWGLLLVQNLSEIVFDEMAFDQLVLKRDYKKMIRALVETHAGQEDGLAKDLIAGKGGGMVMVLHGKPGTGKTLTAEAISEHLKCPLYTVSSGELGIQAAQLEKQLNDILEMTASWGAVVLIDEADVFLEARDSHDLARNSLVSVFLRLLEYHTGVLILTTNRIRSFDRAFVSRFTIALHYPDLNEESRLLIWQEFLSRAGFKFGSPTESAPSKPLYIAHSDLVALAKKPFNGRVIKQLVRGAQALAIAGKESLDLSHINTVLGITEQFEADWKELEFTDDIKGGGAGQGLLTHP